MYVALFFHRQPYFSLEQGVLFVRWLVLYALLFFTPFCFDQLADIFLTWQIFWFLLVGFFYRFPYGGTHIMMSSNCTCLSFYLVAFQFGVGRSDSEQIGCQCLWPHDVEYFNTRWNIPKRCKLTSCHSVHSMIACIVEQAHIS